MFSQNVGPQRTVGCADLVQAVVQGFVGVYELGQVVEHTGVVVLFDEQLAVSRAKISQRSLVVLGKGDRRCVLFSWSTGLREQQVEDQTHLLQDDQPID